MVDSVSGSAGWARKYSAPLETTPLARISSDVAKLLHLADYQLLNLRLPRLYTKAQFDAAYILSRCVFIMSKPPVCLAVVSATRVDLFRCLRLCELNT